jgi:hypothetical protein
MDRILNMLIRRVIGRMISRGADAGIARATRGRADATPEQQAQARQSAQRSKQALKLARRIGRF